MRINGIIFTLLLSGAIAASAQSRYDDDIYYNASKDTKTKQENAAYKKAQAERKAREAEQQRLAEQEAFNRLYQAYYGNYEPERGGEPYEAAGDQTIVSGGSDRDVDEYNRRGKYSSDNRQSSDTIVNPEDFQYTRRIERFHNSDVIASNNDPELVNYYYSSQQPEINVYYINNDPFSWNNWGWSGWSPYYAYYSPYYSPYWGWNNWGWNSYWSWNWGWGPSWSWAWGYPGWGYPSWGWNYPGWGWGGYPGWSGPVNDYVASRYTPNGRRPSGIRNGYTGIPQQQHGHLSGNTPSNTHSNRYTLTPGQAGNYRPNTSGNYRPGQSGINPGRDHNNSGYTPSQTSGNRNGNRSYNNNTTTRNNYNNSGSFNSGSRGSWGGGGSSSSGSSHRGGRR